MKKKVADIYEEEIRNLTDNPEGIFRRWCNGTGLFKKIGNQSYGGCLTQIRAYDTMGAYINGKWNQELTDRIKADERIPKDPEQIELKHLPVFAEWQRLVDKLEEADANGFELIF